MDEITKKEGRTILFVSHNMGAISQLCQRCILLEKGEVKEIGETGKVISSYLNNQKNLKHIMRWSDQEAPRNNSIILRQIKLLNVASQPLSRLSAGEGFEAEIEYEVSSGVSAGFVIGFWNDLSELIFISINNTEENFYNKTMTPGIYKTSCQIPTNLFNQGLFSVSLTFFENNFLNPVSLNNIIMFEVGDGPIGRGDYSGDYPGVFRPRLNWETKKI